jgi:hypothetical protein
MFDPPTTHELCEAADLAARQAADILHQLSELRALVDLTGFELPAATRREIETDLHQSTLALYALQLSIREPRRAAPADQ